MAKDKRYRTIKFLLENGHISTLNEIFESIPKSVVAKDLGFNNMRMAKLIRDVDRYIVKDLFKLAALIEVEETVIMNLLLAQYFTDKRIKKKK